MMVKPYKRDLITHTLLESFQQLNSFKTNLV